MNSAKRVAMLLIVDRRTQEAAGRLVTAHTSARAALEGWAARRAVRIPRIAVVDDDESDRALMVRVLSGYGHVRDFRCGHDALAAMRADPFDLAVVDMLLPGTSGAEVIEAIRNSTLRPLLPVLAVSGAMDEPQITEAAISAGATLLVGKREMLGEGGASIFRRLGLRPINANGQK